MLTHGLQAAWLSKLLTGAMALPPPREMQKAVEAEMHWKRTWMPSTSARAAIQQVRPSRSEWEALPQLPCAADGLLSHLGQLHMPKYHDRLLADMGEAVCRKSNPLFEMLVPYNARDYRALFGLPDRTAWMRLKTAIVLVAVLLPSLAESARLALWLMMAVVCAGVYLLPEEPPRLMIRRSVERAVRTPTAAPRSPRHTTLSPRHVPSSECGTPARRKASAAKPIKRE